MSGQKGWPLDSQYLLSVHAFACGLGTTLQRFLACQLGDSIPLNPQIKIPGQLMYLDNISVTTKRISRFSSSTSTNAINSMRRLISSSWLLIVNVGKLGLWIERLAACVNITRLTTQTDHSKVKNTLQCSQHVATRVIIPTYKEISTSAHLELIHGILRKLCQKLCL